MRKHRSRQRSSLGLLAPLLLVLLITGLIAGLVVASYGTAASQLPSPADLQDRANTFQNTSIYDRNGSLLYEIFDKDEGRRTFVPLGNISPNVINAVLATEDPNFYRHPGVDPEGVARAIYYALQNDERRPGGSGIPQQLVKLTFFSADKTVSRKLKEAILAIEVSRRYDKDAILEIYLNHIFFGNLAYGIQAAAQTYFDKPASNLTLAEASLLAGIPQAPATYDPFTNWDAARRRQADVLRLMVEHGFVSPDAATAAWLEWEGKSADEIMAPLRVDFPSPHFVLMVRQILERNFGPEVVAKGGLQVTTTLDLRLQRLAEKAVADGMMQLQEQKANAGNAALVVLDPTTGEILALVGSPNFNNPDIDGQVNMAIVPRQTGSAIKPLTYLAAFEHKPDYWTPATVIGDERTEFPDGPARPPYVPKNFDGAFHGPVSVRLALANSYNIPAVKALQHVGVPALIEVSQRLGITSLTRPDYGLSLTLGGGEVSVLELTSAYAAFANGGKQADAHAIRRVQTESGLLLEDQTHPATRAVMTPEHAFLITSILSDVDARRPAFGNLARLLELPDRPVAAKTGTTDDWRDGWTVGYTPGLVAGVWVGNADNSPMNRVGGVSSAAIIWHEFMVLAHEGRSVQPFVQPSGVTEVEICAATGAATGADAACTERRREWFKADQPPPTPIAPPAPAP